MDGRTYTPESPPTATTGSALGSTGSGGTTSYSRTAPAQSCTSMLPPLKRTKPCSMCSTPNARESRLSSEVSFPGSVSTTSEPPASVSQCRGDGWTTNHGRPRSTRELPPCSACMRHSRHESRPHELGPEKSRAGQANERPDGTIKVVIVLFRGTGKGFCDCLASCPKASVFVSFPQ